MISLTVGFDMEEKEQRCGRDLVEALREFNQPTNQPTKKCNHGENRQRWEIRSGLYSQGFSGLR